MPLGVLQSLPTLAPFGVVLDEARRGAIPELISAYSEDVSAVRDQCEGLSGDGRPGALARLGELVPRLLSELRTRGPRLLVWLDAGLRSDQDEILDGDEVPEGVRRAAMEKLDALNTRIGAYAMWRREVVAALGEGPASIVELAGGNGGFARHLAAHAQGDLQVTATDLDPTHVALAARDAPAGMATRILDATDLRDVTDVGLFVCTQAAHHLGPALTVAMIAQAIARAPRGIVIIDVNRSMLTAGATGVAAATSLSSIVVLDGIQSVRRSFTPAELSLLATLAGAGAVTTRAFGPAYCFLHARA